MCKSRVIKFHCGLVCCFSGIDRMAVLWRGVVSDVVGRCITDPAGATAHPQRINTNQTKTLITYPYIQYQFCVI